MSTHSHSLSLSLFLFSYTSTPFPFPTGRTKKITDSFCCISYSFSGFFSFFHSFSFYPGQIGARSASALGFHLGGVHSCYRLPEMVIIYLWASRKWRRKNSWEVRAVNIYTYTYNACHRRLQNKELRNRHDTRFVRWGRWKRKGIRKIRKNTKEDGIRKKKKKKSSGKSGRCGLVKLTQGPSRQFDVHSLKYVTVTRHCSSSYIASWTASHLPYPVSLTHEFTFWSLAFLNIAHFLSDFRLRLGWPTCKTLLAFYHLAIKFNGFWHGRKKIF